MDVPAELLPDLLDYLRLEFGEDETNPDALQLADLRYAGVRTEGARSVHYWEYPGGSGSRWATATLDGECWSLGTSGHGPDGKPRSQRKAFATLGIRFNRRHKDQPAIKPLRLRLADMPAGGFPVQFANGEQVHFYLELYFPDDEQQPMLTLQVLQEDELLLVVRCQSGMIVCCQIAGYDCELQCGPGPWA